MGLYDDIQNPAKYRFLKLIDDHKNNLLDPVAMLDWTWLRVFILVIPDDDFTRYMEKTVDSTSK